MNRIIKFRAWDRKNKQMYYKVLVGNLDINDPNYTVCCLLVDGQWVNADENSIDLMQSIGLTDDNGKEIYEGDYLVNEYNEIQIVSWRSGAFTETWGHGESGHVFVSGFKICSHAEKYIIIGNKYENPELLTKNQ